MHAGGCLCGRVRFTIEAPLAAIQICHCSQCRKAQGGPFAANIPVAVASLRFTQGRETLSEYESSPGKFRAFCPRCGSPIYSRRTAMPAVLRIRAGTLDEPVAAKIEAHFHVVDQASWWPINDSLPQHEGSAPAALPPS